MTTFTLVVLPTELLTSILVLLDIPDLLTCSRLSRFFQSLVHQSVALQYNIELFAANLVDGPPSHTVKSARLRALHDHQRAWNDIKWSTVQDIILTEEEMSPELSAWELVGGIFAVAAARHLRFIQLPSTLRDVPTREWSIPDIGFNMKDFAMDRSQGLLVVVEFSDPIADHKTLRFHLRRLTDGHPHPQAREPIISHHTTVDVSNSWHVVQIYSKYVAIMLQSLESTTTHVIFWNWRTGERKAVLQGPIQSIAFLTQDIVVCGMCRSPPTPDSQTLDTLSLDLVDLSTTHAELDLSDRTNSLITLLLPPLASSEDASDPEIAIRTDYSSSYALASHHPRPFTTADTDRLVVVSIKAFQADHTYALFVRASTLLDFADTRQSIMDWGAWGPAHTRVLRVDLSDVWFCYVHGLRAVIPSQDTHGATDVLDFNQRALRRSFHHRGPGTRLQGYRIGASRVDDDEDLFDCPVDSALPYRVQSFEMPGMTGQEELEFMLAEDGLVLIQDDHRFKVYSF